MTAIGRSPAVVPPGDLAKQRVDVSPRGAAMPAAVTLAAALLIASPAPRAVAQGQQLEACARGNIPVCRAILARPRLDAGRRAAIEFLLTEIEGLVFACGAGDGDACNRLTREHPELPADLRAPQPSPPRPIGK